MGLRHVDSAQGKALLAPRGSSGAETLGWFSFASGTFWAHEVAQC